MYVSAIKYAKVFAPLSTMCARSSQLHCGKFCILSTVLYSYLHLPVNTRGMHTPYRRNNSMGGIFSAGGGGIYMTVIAPKFEDEEEER